MKDIVIAGKPYKLSSLSKQDKQHLWAQLILSFETYKFTYNQQQLYLFVDKQQINYTPRMLCNIATKLAETTAIPVVFYYDSLKTFERDRLINQGVYFLVSDKYAHLPNLIINRASSSEIVKPEFSPVAQYLMLYHLQVADCNCKSINDLTILLPYSYKAIAKTIKQFENLGLLNFKSADGKTKYIKFRFERRELWDKVQRYLVSPIKKKFYLQEPIDIGLIGSYSALSHYSMLASEDVPTKVITKEQLKDIEQSGYRMLPFEDVQCVQVWKYPPLVTDEQYIDKLSVYLTLKDDRDPRVEKELEIMINNMSW